LRAGRVGLRRTAEELGRAFGGVEVLASGGDTVLRTIPDAPALVIATPGAEPTAPHGYAAIALLDGDLLLDRPDLRSGEEALRRWLNAASLARPADAAVVIVADPSARPVQALIRWDPAGFAAQEFDDRAAAHLPPAARVVALTGAPAAVMQLADAIEAPEGTERLSPAPWTPTPRDDESVAVRLVLRAPLARGAELSAAVRAAATVRSARKEPDFVNVRVDPLDLA
jgi:primosomal protein N' (replication factor Y)